MKKLNQSNPKIFKDVSEYLLAKRKAKDQKNEKLIQEHFKK